MPLKTSRRARRLLLSSDRGAVSIPVTSKVDSALGLPCELFKNQKSKNQNGNQNQKRGDDNAQRRLSSGGRPSSENPIDKKLEGKTSGANAASQTKPKKVNSKNVMTDYFSIAMKECEKEVPSADLLRNEIEEYIAARGCDSYVAPQTITDYVLNRQGFLACEAMNRKIGRMTKELKLSPYVTAGAQYYKAMQGDFNLIMQIINRHSSTQGEEKNAFLELLTNRGF